MKNKPTRVCIPRSKRQTSNGDACKLKQTKNKTTCSCIPCYKRQMSNGDAFSARLQNTSQLKLFGAATENGYAVGASTRYSKGLGMSYLYSADKSSNYFKVF